MSMCRRERDILVSEKYPHVGFGRVTEGMWIAHTEKRILGRTLTQSSRPCLFFGPRNLKNFPLVVVVETLFN